MNHFITPHTIQFPLQVIYSLEKPQCRRIFVGFLWDHRRKYNYINMGESTFWMEVDRRCCLLRSSCVGITGLLSGSWLPATGESSQSLVQNDNLKLAFLS